MEKKKAGTHRRVKDGAAGYSLTPEGRRWAMVYNLFIEIILDWQEVEKTVERCHLPPATSCHVNISTIIVKLQTPWNQHSAALWSRRSLHACCTGFVLLLPLGLTQDAWCMSLSPLSFGGFLSPSVLVIQDLSIAEECWAGISKSLPYVWCFLISLDYGFWQRIAQGWSDFLII